MSNQSETKSALDIQEGGDHYKGYPIQPVEYCQKNGIQFMEGNAIKYLTRHQDKNGAEDLKKAIHYTQLALEHSYGVRCRVVYEEPEK